MDLLAQVPLLGGTDELVLVHVEIERHASKAMGERLASYAMALQPAESFLQRDEPLAWALASLMKSRGRAPVEHALDCLTRIGNSQEPLDPAQQYLLINCVGTYVQLDPEQEEELMTTLDEHGRRDILEIYDSGITCGPGLARDTRGSG